MSGSSKPFADAEDYPQTSPAAGKPILVVNHDNPLSFIELIDTLGSYIGCAGKFIVVNATENGLTTSSATDIYEAIETISTSLGVISAIFEADNFIPGKAIDMEQNEVKGLRLEQIAGNPLNPVNGQIWYDTIAKCGKTYQNNAVQPFLTAADAANIASFISDVSTLQGTVATNIRDIENISSDSVLSKSEKPKLEMDYDVIIAEQAGIDVQALQYGVTTEKTTYDNAITALTGYLTALDPAYNDYTEDTTIVRDTFNTKFSDVYKARQAIINKINDNNYTLLDQAFSDTAAALSAANDATANAAIALAEIASISSDGILSPQEKTELILKESIITTEKTGIDAQADLLSVSRVEYDGAYADLEAYLGTLDPAWNDNTVQTVITRTSFDTAWGNLYIERQSLLNSIYAANKALSDAAKEQADLGVANAATAQQAADVAQQSADDAQADATRSLSSILDMSNDSKLIGLEKITLIREVADINADKILLDAQANIYSITTALTAYNNAVIALGTYLSTLNPAWNDNTQTTNIVRSVFDTKFSDVYATKTALCNEIYEAARLYAQAEAQNDADAAHHDRTKTVFDNGMISSGTFAVGDGIVVGNANAGMTGIVTATPDTDIRFWAGTTLANRNTAPFRVQNDGTLYSSKAVLAGGWVIDSDAIYYGTKKITDGYSVNGITLANDGSLHSKNFYINADGSVSFTAVESNIKTVPVSTGSRKGALKIEGNQIWEDNEGNSYYGYVMINLKGYQGGTTKARHFIVGDGKGTPLLAVLGDIGDGSPVIQLACNAIHFPSIPTFNPAEYLWRDGNILKVGT